MFRTLVSFLAVTLLAVVVLAPISMAQSMDEETRVTFREAVRIPGKVLPAGTYYFERADHGNGPNLNRIQIYNADHTRLIDTIETVTAERRFATGATMLTFAEGSQGNPPALLQWFYPGMRDGHAFVYSPHTQQALEASKQDYVLSNSKGAEGATDASGD